MVDLEMDEGLAVITIDRPQARNAISLETMDQFDKALDGAEGAAALVITGAGDRQARSSRFRASGCRVRSRVSTSRLRCSGSSDSVRA